MTRIHHIGKVVGDIKAEFAYYASLGFSIDEKIYTDTEQKVKVGKVTDAQGLLIELLEPLDETSPIWNFSQKHKGFHHICIEVASIEGYLVQAKEQDMIQLSGITTSVFENRRVCFLGTKERDIVEIIET